MVFSRRILLILFVALILSIHIILVSMKKRLIFPVPIDFGKGNDDRKQSLDKSFLMSPNGLIINFALNFVLPYLLYHIERYTFLIFASSIGISFVFGWFKMKN